MLTFECFVRSRCAAEKGSSQRDCNSTDRHPSYFLSGCSANASYSVFLSESYIGVRMRTAHFTVCFPNIVISASLLHCGRGMNQL